MGKNKPGVGIWGRSSTPGEFSESVQQWDYVDIRPECVLTQTETCWAFKEQSND